MNYNSIKISHSLITTKGVVFSSTVLAVLIFFTFENYIHDAIGMEEIILSRVPNEIKKIIMTLVIIILPSLDYYSYKRLFTTRK
ncbi:MAG: hypothetical protein ACPKPY_04390 [Nitrososphaeraceae archaeon]